MEPNELKFNSIEEYQKYLKERQELLAYCKKINQGIENLTKDSGERAFWELVQNARDLDENCQIRIELHADKVVFSHHGTPFDYLSLLALVNQNSSKDNPGANLVGQYGTGFMTTHVFNDVVTVNGPFKVMSGPNEITGYVSIKDFKIDRSNRKDTDKAIDEMRHEMNLVENMHLRTPIYEEIPNKWTSFTYQLDDSTAQLVSGQLKKVISFIPLVLAINEQIKEFSIIDELTDTNLFYSKSEPDIHAFNDNWNVTSYKITESDKKAGRNSDILVSALQSKDASDVIILPPYPECCGPVENIPSLFLWFPLLGTDRFGVNFIFHSKRFHPVEKRNNIMLPEVVNQKIEKGRWNENVLIEMTEALFEFYRKDNNDHILKREMCVVDFKTDNDDEELTRFYNGMQKMWNKEIPSWEIIPTDSGQKSLKDSTVRVLHPEFYSNLDKEQYLEYEPIMSEYAKLVKDENSKTLNIPSKDIIAWSKTIERWKCDDEQGFYITVKDVCDAIQSKSESLHKFLSFLKDSGNIDLTNEHALIPNRQGVLRKAVDLRHGDFMTADLYELTKPLMGTDADRIVDTSYIDIRPIGVYKEEDLQRAITQTVNVWRNSTLKCSDKKTLENPQLESLIKFCSATSQAEFTNFRGRMMRQITRIYDKEFCQIYQPKIGEKEDDFYNPAFNLLLDNTLLLISRKDKSWVESNKSLLLDFLKTYSDSKDSDRLEKLDTYNVIPNQNGKLCFKSNLSKNINTDESLAGIYKAVLGEDLRDSWVDCDFEGLFSYLEITADDVASKVEKALTKGQFKDTIVLDIIEKTENETIDNWRILFSNIFNQRESIRYNLGTPEERRAINRIMRQNNPGMLQKMADIAERSNAAGILRDIEDIIAQTVHNAYIKMLGSYAERLMLGYLEAKLAPIGVSIENVQDGQDFILRKNGFDDYYIEVKSRWKNDQSVEMSQNQFSNAVAHPNSYALIGMNMYHLIDKAENGEAIELSEIYDKIKILDNIGYLEEDLYRRAKEAYKGTDTEITLSGSYSVRVPQNVFNDYPLSFNEFIERLKVRFGAGTCEK